MDKTAMIFAAGLGTRLRPLTNDRPKALVRLNGKPLLQRTIEYLRSFGFRRMVINVHHFGQQIIDFLAENNDFGCEILISDERSELLETGGGLQQAASLLGDQPFLVYNSDVLTNLDLNAFYEAHLASEALATLAVRERKSSRYLLFDENRQLCGWKNTKTGEQKIRRQAKNLNAFAFSGIHVIDPKLLGLMTQKGKFSITTTYLRLAANEQVLGYPHDTDYWFDLGKPERLEAASHFLKQKGLT